MLPKQRILALILFCGVLLPLSALPQEMSPAPTETSEPNPTLSPSSQPTLSPSTAPSTTPNPNRIAPIQRPSGTSTIRSFKYKCVQGRFFQADFQGDKAVIIFDTGAKYLFRQVESGSGIRYANGSYMLYGKGNNAYIEQNQKRFYDKCAAQPL